MSEYSLSVNDEALHPVLISDYISGPDVITERQRDTHHTHKHTFLTPHTGFMIILGLEGHQGVAV